LVCRRPAETVSLQIFQLVSEDFLQLSGYAVISSTMPWFNGFLLLALLLQKMYILLVKKIDLHFDALFG
jgi:hypothetical protein